MQVVVRITLCFPLHIWRCFVSIGSGVYVFGDSLLDAGNNNYLALSLANGVDFPTGKATRRFSNGKNVADFLGLGGIGWYTVSDASSFCSRFSIAQLIAVFQGWPVEFNIRRVSDQMVMKYLENLHLKVLGMNERSNDMFSDDIFGESLAGVRKYAEAEHKRRAQQKDYGCFAIQHSCDGNRKDAQVLYSLSYCNS